MSFYEMDGCGLFEFHFDDLAWLGANVCKVVSDLASTSHEVGSGDFRFG
jgi:hypothetical protein